MHVHVHARGHVQVSARAALSCIGRSWGTAEANKVLQAATDVLTSPKLGVAEVEALADGIVKALGTPAAKVQLSALSILARIDAEKLIVHVPRIVAFLSKSAEDVRRAAIRLLGNIEPVACLADEFGFVHNPTVEVLCDMGSDLLTDHAPAIVSHLVHYNAEVRRAALTVMSCLDDKTLAIYQGPLAAHVDDENEDVGAASADLLARARGAL